MRKRVRKTLASLMAAMLLLSAFGVQAFAEDTSSAEAAAVQGEQRSGKGEGQQLQATKEWKTKRGETVENSNIPFGKVEVDIQQYYKVGTYPDLTEEPIGEPFMLALTGENSWTDAYRNPVEDYSYFKAVAERVYDKNENLIVTYGLDMEGSWLPTYAEGYSEKDLYGWIPGEFEFTREYEGAQVQWTEIKNKNEAVFDLPGSGILVLKKGSDYLIWMPYMEQLSTEARAEIKKNVGVNYRNPRFLDEDTGSTLENAKIIYAEGTGNVHLNFENQSDWSWFAYGPFEFQNNTISSSLVNRLDTDFQTNIKVIKIWDDNNSPVRPTTIDVELKDGTQVKNTINLSTGDASASDYNIWNQTVSVPKYREDGTTIQYEINEPNVPEGYGNPEYDQENLTVTNRLANVNLTVEKQVTGNMGDHNKEFTFTMKLLKDGRAYIQPLSYMKGEESGTLTATNDSYTFTLKDTEKIAIAIPFGCSYDIMEENADYDVSIKVGDGEPANNNIVNGTANSDTGIVFTNTKNIVPPTGVSKGTGAYMAMFFCGLGAAAVFGRRKRSC